MEKARVIIGGIDEAGRGPLAGPVTAAAVVLPKGFRGKGICDSKQLTEAERDECYVRIVAKAVAWAVVSVGPRRIEQLNIRAATRLAMELSAYRVEQCLKQNGLADEVLFLVDGNMPLRPPLLSRAIIGGDATERVISAASIIAKVTRDRWMRRLAEKYPSYGFEGHKGYPTKSHRELLVVHGPSRIHRRTFSGVKELCPGWGDDVTVDDNLILEIEEMADCAS